MHCHFPIWLAFLSQLLSFPPLSRKRKQKCCNLLRFTYWIELKKKGKWKTRQQRTIWLNLCFLVQVFFVQNEWMNEDVHVSFFFLTQNCMPSSSFMMRAVSFLSTLFYIIFFSVVCVCVWACFVLKCFVLHRTLS